MSERSAVIKAVCISEKKGEQKHPVEEIRLVPELGIPGDAHAGNWHRQVSILGADSVARLQEKISIPLFPGAFADVKVIKNKNDVWVLKVNNKNYFVKGMAYSADVVGVSNPATNDWLWCDKNNNGKAD